MSLPDDLLAALNPEPRGHRRPLRFVATLLMVAAATVVLPLIYFVFVGAVATLVGMYTQYAVPVLFRSHNLSLADFLLLVPIFVGLSLILALIKPLVTGQAPSPRGHRLLRVDQPLLHAFVEEIARRLGTERPACIEVSCSPNASVSLVRGRASRGSTLTLGLPIVATMSAQQLAGVIAHELGHTTQTWSGRAIRLTSYVNAWLARVAFVDPQHTKSREMSAFAPWPFVITVWLSKVALYVTRRIFRVLLWCGHWIGVAHLRQFELYADRYEAALVGTATFRKTTEDLRLLDVAHNYAIQKLNLLWSQRRLSDDFVAIVEHEFRNLSSTTRAEVLRGMNAEKTHWSDSHPCDRERIQAIEQFQSGSRAECNLSSKLLFRDFGILSKFVTEEFYRVESALGFAEGSMVPSDTLLDHFAEMQESSEVLRDIFGESMAQPFDLLGPGAQVTWSNPGVRSAEECARPSAALKETFQERIDTFNKLKRRESELIVGIALLQAGIEQRPSEFGLKESYDSEVEIGKALELARDEAKSGSNMALLGAQEYLEENTRWIAQKIISLAEADTGTCTQCKRDALIETQSAIERAIVASASIETVREGLLQLEIASSLRRHLDYGFPASRLHSALDDLTRKFEDTSAKLNAQLGNYVYPFRFSTRDMTFDEFREGLRMPGSDRMDRATYLGAQIDGFLFMYPVLIARLFKLAGLNLPPASLAIGQPA